MEGLESKHMPSGCRVRLSPTTHNWWAPGRACQTSYTEARDPGASSIWAGPLGEFLMLPREVWATDKDPGCLRKSRNIDRDQNKPTNRTEEGSKQIGGNRKYTRRKKKFPLTFSDYGRQLLHLLNENKIFPNWKREKMIQINKSAHFESKTMSVEMYILRSLARRVRR